jgi:FkbM family methyltransferase
MGTLRVLVSTADLTIARSVYAGGDWDPLLVGAAFRALAASGWQAAGRTFVDVGANFGVYALAAVTQFGFARAVAFEPDPGAFGLLVENIGRNGLADQVVAVNAALSGTAGQLRLSRGRGNAGDNRIVRGRPERSAWQQRDVVEVPAVTLDEQVRAGLFEIDHLGLLWLDIQGHEADALDGARAVLATGVPLVTEYSTRMLGPDRARLDAMLIEAYDVFVDLSWSVLTDRVIFQPVAEMASLGNGRWGVETDLLLLRTGG